MSKAWVGAGAWAADLERVEAEEAASAADTATFPSLKEAANAKQRKKKMTLNEFHAASAVVGGNRGAESKGLTPDEMLRLPTGPKERSAEEMQLGRLGGGFSSYGRLGSFHNRVRDSDGAWGGRRQYDGFDDRDRGASRVSKPLDYDLPSRADEADNWATMKKTVEPMESDRRNRYSSLNSGLGGASKADEVDNWATLKKSIPSRQPSFGAGFRGSDLDRWSRRSDPVMERERPRLALDPPKAAITAAAVVEKKSRPSPFGDARPREEVLAEKGLDWKKTELEKNSNQSSRPTSAQSSRPSSTHSNRSDGSGIMQGGNAVVKPRTKVNPFGDAKPREVILEEKGHDWRKMDVELEHRGVDRPETEEERMLKREIDILKKDLEKETVAQPADRQQHPLQDMIAQKEQELELLILDLDDKVRFGPKAVERPGSGSSRAPSFTNRPSSRAGSFDDSKSSGFADRPLSRGSQDSGWDARDREFCSSTSFDRSAAREPW